MIDLWFASSMFFSLLLPSILSYLYAVEGEDHVWRHPIVEILDEIDEWLFGYLLFLDFYIDELAVFFP